MLILYEVSVHFTTVSGGLQKRMPWHNWCFTYWMNVFICSLSYLNPVTSSKCF